MPYGEELKRRVDDEVRRRYRPPTDFDYHLARFFRRAARIAFGCAAGAAAAWLAFKAIEILQQPFAVLSPLSLLIGLAEGFLALGAVGLAGVSAFGEGESREEFNARREGSFRWEVEQELSVRAEVAEHEVLRKR